MTLLLNVVLTILGWLPGVVHAIWVIFMMPGKLIVGRAAGPVVTYQA